jgi:hypothetical protein
LTNFSSSQLHRAKKGTFCLFLGAFGSENCELRLATMSSAVEPLTLSRGELTLPAKGGEIFENTFEGLKINFHTHCECSDESERKYAENERLAWWLWACVYVYFTTK